MKIIDTNKHNIYKLDSGLTKRKQQLASLLNFIETHNSIRLQVNFCELGSSDHCCVTLSGLSATEVAPIVISSLKKQIDAIDKKLKSTRTL